MTKNASEENVGIVGNAGRGHSHADRPGANGHGDLQPLCTSVRGTEYTEYGKVLTMYGVVPLV